MGTSPYVNNSPLISLLLSRFAGKKYFHGNMGTYEIGELFFCWGRSLKIHIEIKRELFTQRREREQMLIQQS
jgi:hypothetical protein